MRIEEYLGSLPPGLMSGDDAELPDGAYRDVMELAGLERGELFCHLGCGSGRGVRLAIAEYGARGVGVDSDPAKIEKARGAAGAEWVCADAVSEDWPEPDVLLLWFSDPSVVRAVAGRVSRMRAGARVVTLAEPLPGVMPKKTEYPYILHETPLAPASLREQFESVFGAKCMDFATAWEHAERYSRAVSGNADRFLTIMQSVLMWINARNMDLACSDRMPEPVKSYAQLLRRHFGIEVEHLLGH